MTSQKKRDLLSITPSAHRFCSLLQGYTALRFSLWVKLSPPLLLTMASPSRTRKPSAQIESIIINNTLDEMDQWIPQTIVKGSWVLLQARRQKCRSKNEFFSSWKGRVKDFRLAENKKAVKEVLIQHVFMHKEVQLIEWPEHLPLYRPNCKFLS